MKIAAIETIHISIPFIHHGPSTGFAATNFDNLATLIVKVETDAGITGYGEAFGYNAIPATRAAIEQIIKPHLIGRDATQISALMSEIQQTLHIFGRYGPVLYGISGIDIALWDIASKAAGLPLYRLFGGASRTELPVYASLLRYGDPEVVRDRTADAVSQGYQYVKLHERTVPSIRAAREAAGDDVAIMVDVNCPWTVQQSIRMARAFEPYDIFWLEEPVWPPENFDGLAEVTAATPVPIAAGENYCTAWQFKALLDAGAVTYAQPSVTKVGGITEFRKVATLAETANVLLAPHSPYFGPGFLATLHLAATSTEPVERFFGNLEATLFGDMVNPTNALLPLPQGPGLGCDPDPDVIREYLVE